MSTILITGITGLQGSAVAHALLARGHRVLGLVRDPSSARARALDELGVSLRVGDLTAPDQLTAAFAGIDALYAITTPFSGGASEEITQGSTIISAAQRSAVPRVIYASVAAAARADVPHFTSKARIEEQLAQSRLRWTVIAPSYFYENASGAAREGSLTLPLGGDTPLHQIALVDLGAIVVAVLERFEDFEQQRVELAGDAPTPLAMARDLGVPYHQIPVAQVAARNPDLAAMYAFLEDHGYGIDVSAVRQRFPDVDWHDFQRWASEELSP